MIVFYWNGDAFFDLTESSSCRKFESRGSWLLHQVAQKKGKISFVQNALLYTHTYMPIQRRSMFVSATFRLGLKRNKFQLACSIPHMMFSSCLCSLLGRDLEGYQTHHPAIP
jgi:hypothetical protein